MSIRLGTHSEDEEDDEDEETTDTPLPLWLDGDSLAPPCQADMDVVRAIIDFAEVTADDVLYDLGCGDGRICIEAAESRGARACGVEIEEHLAEKFRRRVASKGLQSKVSVIHGDLRDVDLSDATVVVTYLLPQAMADIAETHLLPLLRRAGTHQVSESLEDSSCVEQRAVVGIPGVREHSPEGKYAAEQSHGFESHEAQEIRGALPAIGNSSYAPVNSPAQEEGSNSYEKAGKRQGGARNVGITSKKDCGQGDGHSARGAIPQVPGGAPSRPCRIVCNTWGLPGVTPVKEAAVGLYMGVRLHLFTQESVIP